MRLECVAVTRVATRALLLSIGIGVALSRPGAARQQPVTERPSRPWTQARTAWGDPDLGGVWTSDNNFSVPLERPADVAGKAMFDGADLENALRARARMIAAVADGGAVGAGPSHWYENLTARSRRSSLIIDPPDGRLPALTAEAQQRAAQAAVARRQPRSGGFLGGSQPLGPLHHGRAAERDVSDRLQQQRADPAGARLCHDHARDDARHAHHSARWPPTPLTGHPPLPG